MSTIVLWILLAAPTNQHGGLTVVGRFEQQAACDEAAAEIRRISREAKQFPYANAICIPAGKHQP